MGLNSTWIDSSRLASTRLASTQFDSFRLGSFQCDSSRGFTLLMAETCNTFLITHRRTHTHTHARRATHRASWAHADAQKSRRSCKVAASVSTNNEQTSEWQPALAVVWVYEYELLWIQTPLECIHSILIQETRWTIAMTHDDFNKFLLQFSQWMQSEY